MQYLKVVIFELFCLKALLYVDNAEFRSCI